MYSIHYVAVFFKYTLSCILSKNLSLHEFAVGQTVGYKYGFLFIFTPVFLLTNSLTDYYLYTVHIDREKYAVKK